MKNTKKQTQEKQQKKQVATKNYLQQQLVQYLIDNDTEHLNNIAYIIVKKTMFTYSKTSSQGGYLYTQARHKHTQNADVQDLKSECIFAILQALKNNDNDTTNIIKQAFRQVNDYLYSLRSIQVSNRPYQYSIEELTDNGTQLVEIRKGIVQLVNDTDNYIFDNDTDNEKRIQDRKTIQKILAYLTPLQKQIAKMLALGDSQRQIATKLNRAVSTINQHINNIRKIANKLQ